MQRPDRPEHWPARGEDGRDIHAQRRQNHAGDNFVAVGDADDAIEAMRAQHGLYRIGDQFAAGQAHLHPVMAHGDAVADRDGIELEGHASRRADLFLDELIDRPQMAMAGNDVGVRRANRDEGLAQILALHPRREEEGTVGRALITGLDGIAMHNSSSGFETGFIIPRLRANGGRFATGKREL